MVSNHPSGKYLSDRIFMHMNIHSNANSREEKFEGISGWAIMGSAQGLTTPGGTGSVVPGTELGLATCKESALPCTTFQFSPPNGTFESQHMNSTSVHNRYHQMAPDFILQ